LAHCRLAGDRRLFRVDRIRSVEASGDVFEPPARPLAPTNVDYTPSADAIYARLALGPGARWVAEYYPVEVLEDTGEEMVIRFAMSDARVGARLLLRLGDQARLIEGREVREETERLREAILARYEVSRA
ncbi:MAG: WYL domain-containing protein, partial [Acidimicrobiia bacterium]|nr:WYL domain-containing protein [Acidimicrobiia bacterium]